ncbi:hypothetical protein Tco_0938445 [Tanacetum coccineum]|uniref:Uncharacterized protein n=1 Tax=Tanacetum coccineum TaxID=301880 RepID=A0ABQ5DH69_9ASTR
MMTMKRNIYKADDDDDEELTESDNDGDDFVHPKLTTHDDEIIHEEETKKMIQVIFFRQHTEATSLIDTSVTAIMEPSFTAQVNRPPTPHPIVTESTRRQLSEFRQTNQYAEALSSIPSTVDQYLAHKMQEAVDVAVQLKYDRIRECRLSTANQQILETMMTELENHQEQVKKEVSKINPKVEKLVTDQLESEVLVRSSKEANTSHAVAANLSELELKKILIDKMEANNSINRPRDWEDEMTNPPLEQTGIQKKRSGKEPASTSAPSETTTKTAGKTTSTGSKTHKKSASQSAHRKYSTSVTKTKAADYGHIKWIEDLVPNSMWSQTIVKYDKFALWGISHWGKKRRQFYAFATLRESARDVYSKRRIIAVTKVEIVEWHDYKHLD